MEKSVKIRRFVRDVSVVVGIVVFFVISIVGYFVFKVRQDISEQYIFEATNSAVLEFNAMQESVENSLQQVRDYGESGLISLSDPEKMKKLLLPVFGKKSLLSGIIIANSKGDSYFLQPDGSDRKSFDGDESGFNVRARPWYAPALNQEGIYWTEQYRFFTLNQLGVSASVAFNSPQEKGKMVAAVDVLLPDLYRKIRRMAPSKNSEFFIFRRDELLFLPEKEIDSSGFIPLNSVTNTLLNRAHTLWNKGRGNDGKVFSIVNEGKIWWCGFRPLEDVHQNIWMAVMVPESDILGVIGHRRKMLLLLGSGIVLLASLGAFWLIRRYAKILEDTEPSKDFPEDIEALIQKGENRYVEFKSTMRMNLHSKKPGKEIELAWLKGVAAFLNTDGGTLLLGVTDDGEITGLERDVFENEDKCRLHFKNLIATHIGADMSKYIRFRLVPMAGKTVGVVHCLRASEPIFLKNGNKEAFYIRNGPSSDELPVSKALNYIKHRS